VVLCSISGAKLNFLRRTVVHILNVPTNLISLGPARRCLKLSNRNLIKIFARVTICHFILQKNWQTKFAYFSKLHYHKTFNKYNLQGPSVTPNFSTITKFNRHTKCFFTRVAVFNIYFSCCKPTYLPWRPKHQISVRQTEKSEEFSDTTAKASIFAYLFLCFTIFSCLTLLVPLSQNLKRLKILLCMFIS
jgi:hypothetical protein